MDYKNADFAVIREALDKNMHQIRVWAALDRIEQNTLTPEEARLALKGIKCRQANGWTTNRELWAKLERIANG